MLKLPRSNRNKCLDKFIVFIVLLDEIWGEMKNGDRRRVEITTNENGMEGTLTTRRRYHCPATSHTHKDMISI